VSGGLEQLLTVQDHDTALDQLHHRRETLPEKAELARVADDLAAIEAYLADVVGRRDVVAARQKRLEDEIAGLEAKVAELDARLYSGAVTVPRELQAMQADIDSLKRRRSSLEDGVLEAMEEREPLDGEVASLEGSRQRLDEEAQRLRAAIAEAEADIAGEIETVEDLRREAAAGLPDDLAELYDSLRPKFGGVAVARLEPGGRCGGCHLTLPATEVARIKREPPDAVIRCDQCGRLLVRTTD
jgi:uncharacterized protein